MKTDYRTVPLSTFALLCSGAIMACSGTDAPSNTTTGTGGVLLNVGNSGTGGTGAGTADPQGGTGGIQAGTGTGAATGTGTGTETNPGATGGSNGATPGTTTENVYGCAIPTAYDHTSGLITDFTATACAGVAKHSAQYCFGGGGQFSGEISAPYADACGQSTVVSAPTTGGLSIKGTISGPTSIRFWFEPCAYVHAYNSIQVEESNQGPAIPVTIAVKTVATTPTAEGGECALASCIDGYQTKKWPGAQTSGLASSNVLTYAFVNNTGASPAISYYRNQITGFELKLDVPCGTSQQVDLVINHVIFYNSPYG